MFANNLIATQPKRNNGAELPTLFSANASHVLKSKRNWDRLISPTLAIPLRAARTSSQKFIPTL
jgi:hypothetical protein